MPAGRGPGEKNWGLKRGRGSSSLHKSTSSSQPAGTAQASSGHVEVSTRFNPQEKDQLSLKVNLRERVESLVHTWALRGRASDRRMLRLLVGELELPRETLRSS